MAESSRDAVERGDTEIVGANDGGTNAAVNGSQSEQNNRNPPKPPNIRVETRPGTHRYWFRRPQPLQYVRDGNFVQNVHSHEEAEEAGHAKHEKSAETQQQMWSDHGPKRVATSLIPLPSDDQENYVPVVRRRQLDIFLDLLWVGIIGNLSDLFAKLAFDTPDADYGYSFLAFIVLFMIAWQMWNFLRRFLNEYYLDDLFQRAFVVWILSLALLFGNTSPYFRDGYGTTTLTVFLVARASFVFIDTIYSVFFIPELRRLYMIHFILTLPSVGLNIGAIFTSWPTRGALLIPAILWETVVAMIIASPVGDRLLQGNVKKAADPEHYIERLENFFIIILGNGVFILIQGSPLGAGLTGNTGLGVSVLIIYYYLFCLYFSGDGSKNYIHPVRRSWWTTELWVVWHVQMYASVLLLEVALITLVHKSGNDLGIPSETTPSSSDGSSNPARFLFSREESPTTTSTSTPDDIAAIHTAKWTAAICMSCSLLLMTAIALLSRPLDPPGTLLINNRYVRLAPRVLFMIVMVCIPLKSDIGTATFLGVMLAGLVAVALFEWGGAKVRGGAVFEPRRKIQ